ncbi:MAG: hypothetical protein AAFN77_22670 [Planctomycetota bacterium]
MGVHPYWYEQPFESTTEATLKRLQQRVFDAGEFNPVIAIPKFPFPNGEANSHGFRTIEEVVEESAEEGTRSILDIECFSGHQAAGCTSIISAEMCEFLFGTMEPDAALVRDRLPVSEAWNELDRGECLHLIAKNRAGPKIVFFWGLSFD